MSAYRDLHHALTDSLMTLNALSLGNLPIAFEGQDFNPEDKNQMTGDIFIDESYLYGDQQSLSKDTLDEITGIYQLSVYQRSGKGIADVLDIVDAIINNYVHNAKFTSGEQVAVVINSSRSPARIADGWYIVDISISFKSDKLR